MQLEDKHGASPQGKILGRFYATLLESFGPQGWWPARTRWEVIWGAILTQNTTWRNATLALKSLRKAGLLARRRFRQIPIAELEALIRPAGFFRQKARALHNFAQWIEQAHGGSLDALFAQGAAPARAQLLTLKGIGPETADAILLYSGRHPVFVADAYTRRVLSRHGLLSPTANYHSAQQFLHQHLPPDEALFNEFHALLVDTAKRFCHRNKAHCEECPLGEFLTRSSKRETRKSKLETRDSARHSGFDSDVPVLAER
jgi:endonuclease-3 related protein